MPRLPRRRPQLLASLALTSFVAACAAQPQVVRIVVVHENAPSPGLVAAQPAEVAMAQSKMTAPTQPAEVAMAQSKMTAPTRPAEVAMAQSKMTTPTPVIAPPQDCQNIRAYSTGWVEAECEGMQLRIQAGYAAKPNPNMLASLALEEVGRKTLGSIYGYSSRTKIRLAGKNVEARDFVIRQPATVADPWGSGDSMTRDPNGAPRYRALFAQFKVRQAGKIGVSCVAPVERFDRARCHQLMEGIANKGLPGGAETLARVSAPVSVAGVKLRLGRGCWTSSPRSVHCIGKGGMDWTDGSSQEMDALVTEKVRLLGGGGTVLSDGTKLKKTSESTPCMIGRTQSTCTRAAFYGVRPTASTLLHLAYVPQGKQRATVIECEQHMHLGVAPMCEQFFRMQ